jgi:hypothetical protein
MYVIASCSRAMRFRKEQNRVSVNWIDRWSGGGPKYEKDCHMQSNVANSNSSAKVVFPNAHDAGRLAGLLRIHPQKFARQA